VQKRTVVSDSGIVLGLRLLIRGSHLHGVGANLEGGGNAVPLHFVILAEKTAEGWARERVAGWHHVVVVICGEVDNFGLGVGHGLCGDFPGGTGDDFREAVDRGRKEEVRLGEDDTNGALIDRGGRKDEAHGGTFEERVTNVVAWNQPLAILFQHWIQSDRIVPERILPDVELPGDAGCVGEAGPVRGRVFALCHNSLSNLLAVQTVRRPAALTGGHCGQVG